MVLACESGREKREGEGKDTRRSICISGRSESGSGIGKKRQSENRKFSRDRACGFNYERLSWCPVWSVLIGRSGAADTRIAVSRMHRDLGCAELLPNCHSMLKSDLCHPRIWEYFASGRTLPAGSEQFGQVQLPKSFAGPRSRLVFSLLTTLLISREGKKLPGEVGPDCRTSRRQRSRDKVVTFERKANPSLFQGAPDFLRG